MAITSMLKKISGPAIEIDTEAANQADTNVSIKGTGKNVK